MKILVVVDMQNDFISGVLGTDEARAIVSKVVERINQARKNGEKVIFTQDCHYDDDYLDSIEGRHLPIPHCIDGTWGWRFCESVENLITEKEKNNVVYKDSFGAYELPRHIAVEFYEEEDPITEITLIGLCTGYCVISNAILLKSFFSNPEYPVEINVDASCCACASPESHKRALETMKVLHINVLNEEG